MTVYNINYGYNEEIMDACRTLREYAMYVEQVRTYAKQMPLAEAVEKAVDYCIKAGILSDFLRKNRAEAIKMSIYEYDERAHHKLLYEEGVEDGIEQGIEQGLRITIRNMLARGMSDEDIMSIAECGQELIEQVRG